MKTVYKYTEALNDVVTFDLPAGAEILRVDSQYSNTVCLWALVDPGMLNHAGRYIRIAGTGHLVSSERCKYINTFFMLDGRLVFHAFELL